MLTYDQLIKSDASNPEAVKALTGLLGIPTGGGEDFYSNPKNFNANLQNLQRMIGEQVAGARGSSPSGEFQKFGEYQAWGGDVTPLQAQLKGVQDKYAAAGVDFNSSPLAVLQKIAGLSPTLSPTDNGSRVTSQNYGGNVWENIPAGGQPTQVTQPNNNRSLISQTAQAGYIKGYDTNNNYAPVYVPKGVYVPGISATPKQITTSSLTGTGTTSLPGATGTGVNEAGAMVAGASTNIAEIMKQMTPPETEADKKQQSLLDQMASLVGDQANKAADQLTAEQSAGLPDLKKQFADINAQILSKVAAYNALQTDLEGKPITMNSIIGAQAQVQKVQASEIGLLQARAQGLQGQIEVAQQTANRAVDLKYSTIEAKLNVYQAQLNALQPTLNKEEKLQAQAQQILLDQQKQAIADTKSKEKEQNSIILDLISKYPDANISFTDSLASAQAKLKGSKIYQQATRLAGGSGGGGGGGGLDLSSSDAKLQTANQLAFLQDTADKALALAGASGQGSLWRSAGSLLKGSTKSSQLAGLEDTLKTNILSLATDPTIKKFFGPQMSEADVRMMMSGGTTLNHISQTPEQAKAEIARLADLFKRMSKSIGVAPSSGSSGGTTLATGPDGKDYNVPNDQLDAFIKAGGKKK
jgi:hypothetical protein